MSAPITIAEAARQIRTRTVSPVDLARDAIAALRATDATLHSAVLLTEDRAMADAARAEAEIAAGKYRGPMHGIPYGLKDIIDTAGIRTTCHSQLCIDRVPDADATVAARLAEAGGVLVAKMATHEFATGGPAFDLPFPPARNPWNPAHFTGGSSSGSGAAVAAGALPLALGSDTGGSIRLPAAYCGTAGLKPTYGRVSRRGVAPLAFSLDHLGPLTWTVEDCALAMQVLAGYDLHDAGSANLPVPDYAAALGQDVRGLTVGVLDGFLGDDTSEEMSAGIEAAVTMLQTLGMKLVRITLPPREMFHAASRGISAPEGFSIHEQDLRHRPELYARVTRERLMLGAFVTASDYVQAQRLRTHLTAAVDAAFAKADVLATATVPSVAPRIDEVDTGPWRKQMNLTSAFNITGHPALSLCCGFGASGLPLSLQLVGRAFDEATVMRVGHAYEQATSWRERRPALTASPREMATA